MATRYEDCKLDTESETRSFNAVSDPRMMNERRKEIVVVTIMDRVGRDVRGSTWMKHQRLRDGSGDAHAAKTSIPANPYLEQTTNTSAKQMQGVSRWLHTA